MIHPPSVLVMDDDVVGRTAVCDLLAAHGYRIAVARDAHQGIDLAERLAPDLVICELTLPGQSGLRVLERLKAARPGPVVLVSAVGGSALRSLAHLLGVDEFLRKPVSLNRVFEVVARLCPPPTPAPAAVPESTPAHAGDRRQG